MIPSLPKLLGLFAVIWIVWNAFRFFEARQKHKASEAAAQDDDENGHSKAGEDTATPASVDLEECSVCGAWVSGTSCDRDNCPY